MSPRTFQTSNFSTFVNHLWWGHATRYVLHSGNAKS